MIGPRKEIARERRRQIQVRKAFEAGLALDEDQRGGLVSFYVACGEYLVYSMDRLHEQDQIIHDLLVARVPADDDEARKGLAELNARQDASRVVVETFRQALEALKQAGSKGRKVFEKAAGAFVDAFNSMMAPRRNPFFRHTDSLFVDEDWVRIADASDEFHTIESRLFVAVKEQAPEGIDPEQYTVEHPPGE